MAVVSRKELQQFVQAREALAEMVRAGLEPQLMAIDFSDIAVARQEVIALLNAHLSGGAAAAARLSAAFFDLVRERSIGQALGAMPYVMRNPAATEGFVRARIQSVVNSGDPSSFVTMCLDRSDYEIKRASGDCIYQNGYRDPARVYYARVPTGDSCAFCNMLASRGPVYRSAKSAGADDPDHYHGNCKCVITPMWDSVPTAGMSRRFSIATQIEGYDPDALYDKFLEDIDNGVLNRDALAVAAEQAHARNKGRYQVV